MQKLIFTLLVILGSQFSLADTFRAKVTGVHDGDTLTILIGSGKLGEPPTKDRVRMLGLDTPEIDFSGSSQGATAFAARDRLQQLVPVGSTVTIEVGPDGADRHQRLLGRVIVDGMDINRIMLSEGYGLVYFINPRDKRVVSDYIEAAEQAEKNGLGVYAQIAKGELSEPYNFRLVVNRQVGRNLIGDFRTKRLYQAEMAVSVPLSRRVFFSDPRVAKDLGFK